MNTRRFCSSLIPHPSSLIPHPSSFLPHPSSLIPHPSSLTLHPSYTTMAKEKAISIWDPKIMTRALGDSFRKLSPQKMMGNPVMFVVEVGSVITTILLFRDIAKGMPGSGPGIGFDLQITLWL